MIYCVAGGRKGPFWTDLHRESIVLVVLEQRHFWMAGRPGPVGDGGFLHGPKVCD